MNWQIFILFSIIFGSLTTLLQRILMKDQKSDPISYSIFFQIVIGILIGSFGFLTADMSLPNLQNLIPNLIMMIAFFVILNILYFNALKLIEVSEFTVIFSSRIIFTILASSIFLSEGLSIKQLFGALLILAGVILVATKKVRVNYGRGELYAILGAIVIGFATTNDRFILKSLNLYPYVSFAFFAPAITMMLIFPKSLNRMRSFLNFNLFAKSILMCILNALAVIAFYTALKLSNNSSQVVTVNLTSVILTVFLGIILLKERDHLERKIFGATLNFIGLIFLNT